MKKPVQVIPLQDLIGPPPLWWRLWYQLRARRASAGGLERWHWCLGFTLCASLAGGILWLCSSNLHGLILFLVVPGMLYPFELLEQNTRKYQAVEVLIANYAAIGTTGLAYTFYYSYS